MKIYCLQNGEGKFYCGPNKVCAIRDAYLEPMFVHYWTEKRSEATALIEQADINKNLNNFTIRLVSVVEK